MKEVKFGINDWRNRIFESELSPRARLVALALAKYYRVGRACYPSYATLREDTGFTNNHTIARAIAELSEAGFIYVERGKIKRLSAQVQFYTFAGLGEKTDQPDERTDERTGERTSEATGERTGERRAPTKALTGERTGERRAPEIREISIKNIHTSHSSVCIQKSKFKKPTVKEVQTFCDERKNGISGDEFWNFYESKGWQVGKSPMKDWKAAVRTWEKNRKRLYRPVETDPEAAYWDALNKRVEAYERSLKHE